MLVTGGAGYIGSHVCTALARDGYTPVTYDTLEIGRQCAVKLGPLEIGDVRDGRRQFVVIKKHQLKYFVHCAAYIQVAESVAYPEKYYANNVVGTLTLLEGMRGNGLDSIVFSSSAAAFGLTPPAPVTENFRR